MDTFSFDKASKNLHDERVETWEAGCDDGKVLRNLNAQHDAPGFIATIVGGAGRTLVDEM